MKLALRSAHNGSRSDPWNSRLRILGVVAFASILPACGGGGSQFLAADSLIVTSANGMNFSGVPGGPFSPPSMTYTLSNASAASLDWTATYTQPWLSLSQVEGTLDVGTSTTVTVSIGTQANSLAVGSYQDTVTFENTTDGLGDTSRSVGLTVTDPAGLVMTTASRTTGVAPFSAFFDAVGAGSGVIQPTGSPADYASFHYRWQFADPSSGTWSFGGKSKNLATGFVAAHVFETPGNYRVTLRVIEDDGTVHDYYQDLTVTDSDVTYSGQTYYVSVAGNDSNNGQSPTSAFRTVSRAMSTLFASNGPRRVLFRRGDTFTATSTISTSNRTGPFTIGAYGSGAKPIINVTHSGNGVDLDPSVRDVRIVDVDFTGVNTGQGIQVGRDSLILRSTVRNFDMGIGGHDSDCINNTVADCTVLDQAHYGLYYAPAYHPTIINDPPIHLAVMGTRFDNSANSLLRTYVSRSVWQANLFQRSQTSPTRLLGIQEPKQVEFVVLSDNHFNSSSAWILEIGPENSQNGNGTPQVVQNVILEGNTFSLPGPGEVSRFVLIWGRYVTVRNNIFDLTNADWGGVMLVDRRGIGPIPIGVRIENNTVYRADSAPSFRLVDAASQDLTLVRNNIVYSPAVAPSVASGTVFQQNNFTSDPMFEDEAQGNFHLRSESPVIDQGLSITNRSDFDGNDRPMRSAHDIGAFEKP